MFFEDTCKLDDFNCTHLRYAMCVKMLRRAVREAKALAKSKKLDFDTIVFRGISGAIWGTAMAMALNKNMAVVRKPNDDTHSSGIKVEGHKKIHRYLIVDDFTSTGHTVREILKQMREARPDAKCVGLLQLLRQPCQGYSERETFKTLKEIED